MPNTALIVTDLEGCLVPNKGKLHNSLAASLIQKYCLQADKRKLPKIVGGTGRAFQYLECTLQDIGALSELPSFGENGAGLLYVLDNKIVIHPDAFKMIGLKKMLQPIIDQILNETGSSQDRGKEFMITLYPDFNRMVPKQLYELVNEGLRSFLNDLNISFSSAGVDISPKGINKKAGVEFLSAKTGIPLEQMLSIGDADNDIPMLNTTGKNACPGNASEEVKKLVGKRGGYISCYHDTDGVVDIIENVLQVKLKDPRLFSLSDIKAIREKESIICAKVPGRNVTILKEKVIVHIPDEPDIACTLEGIKALAGNSHGGHWRWSAGGLAPIIITADGKKYLVSIYRDKHAPMWPETFSLPTGISSDESEFLDLFHLMIRESVEEYIFKTPQGLFVPKFQCLPTDIDLEAIVRTNYHFAQYFWPEHSLSLVSHPAEFVDLPREHFIEVQWRSQTNTLRGVITLHEEESGIDICKVVYYHIPFSLEDLAIADGEPGLRGKPLDRTIYLFDVQEILRWQKERKGIGSAQIYKSGKPQGTSFIQNPHFIPFLRDVMFAIEE